MPSIIFRVIAMNDPNEFGARLTDDQMSAIWLSRKIGRKIAIDCPEIADDYRQGMTADEIVMNYGFKERYGANEVTSAAVYYALRELIPEEEHRSLGEEHRSIGRQRGIFSMDPKKKAEAVSRGGRTAGNILYREGRGIFGLDDEQKAEVIRRRALANRHVLWSDDEKEYFMALCQNRRYQHQSGSQKGKPDYALIASDLFAWFGTERTKESMKSMKKEIILKAGPGGWEPDRNP